MPKRARSKSAAPDAIIRPPAGEADCGRRDTERRAHFTSPRSQPARKSRLRSSRPMCRDAVYAASSSTADTANGRHEVRTKSDSTGRTRLRGPESRALFATRTRRARTPRRRTREPDQATGRGRASMAQGNRKMIRCPPPRGHRDEVEATGKRCAGGGSDRCGLEAPPWRGRPLGRQEPRTRPKKGREGDPKHDHEKNGEVAVEAADNAGAVSTTAPGDGHVGAAPITPRMTAASSPRPSSSPPVLTGTSVMSYRGRGTSRRRGCDRLASSRIDVLVVEEAHPW